ncbi:MAG: O-antigen ligase family protein [Candidatus Brocadia sp.]|nr:O-antigen ligase family protein [Candidatus Brocadia sp.]
MENRYLFDENTKLNKFVIFILIYFLIGMHYIDLPSINLFGAVDITIETLLFFPMIIAVYISFTMKQIGIKKTYLPVVFLPFLAFFYLFYGIMFIHNNLHRVFFEFRPFMFYFSFLFPVTFIKSIKDAEFIIKGMLIATIVFVPILILQYFIAPKGIIFLAGRDKTFEFTENIRRFVPKAENILLLISFYFYHKTIHTFKKKNLLIFMMFVIVLILTFSRNLWIGFFIGVLIITWCEKHALFRNLPLIIPLGGLFFIAVLLAIIYSGIGQKILLRLGMISYSAIESDNSLKWRVYETDMALKAIKKSPFIGYGLGYKYHEEKKFMFKDAGYYIHNNYLFLWMKMGCFGLVAMGFFIFGLIKEALFIYKNYNKNDILRGIAISTVCFTVARIPAAVVMPVFVEDIRVIILLANLYGIFLNLKMNHLHPDYQL